MRKFSLLATVFAGLLLLSGAALAWTPPPSNVGPADTKTQVINNTVRIMFTPTAGNTYQVYKHQFGDDRSFVSLGTSATYNANGTITTTDPNWGIDTNYGYIYYIDSAIVDYQEYYYFVDIVGGADPDALSNYVVARAFPPTQTRHGEFSEYTNACTACHALHSSNSTLSGGIVGKLLKAPTQTDLCATCHDGSGSKYDIVSGKVRTGADWTQYTKSPGGPFGDQLKAVQGAPTLSSKHNVWRDQGPAFAEVWQAPGSGFLSDPGNANGAWGTTRLTCAACHEPHNRYKNFRLLRGDFGSTAGDYNLPSAFNFSSGVPAVDNIHIRGVSEVNLNGTPPSQDWNTYTKGQAATRYFSGTNTFCLACHRAWGVKDENTAGGDDPDTWGFRRHPVEVAASALQGSVRIIDGDINGNQSRLVDWDGNNLANYVPLEGKLGGPNNQQAYTGNNVVCLTCHVAHGTAAAAGGKGPGNVDLQLEVAYQNNDLNNTTGLSRDPLSGYLLNRQNGIIYGSSSVLARFEPFASACYRCHSTR